MRPATLDGGTEPDPEAPSQVARPALVRALAQAAVLLLLPALLGAATFEEAMARGEAAWARRAEGHVGARPQPGPIEEAIAAFEEALATRPDDLAARNRLLHALYFKGDHLLTDDDELLELFTRSRDLADEGRTMLAARAGLTGAWEDLEPEELAEALADQAEAAGVYFWAGVHWGRWAKYRGKIAAARQGVAKKIRDYATVVILLDEAYEAAGGHRVLGRLHTEAPKLPFVTGWVDRKTAVSELRRAVELGPDDLMNRLYLAEALLEFSRPDREEALELLRDLSTREPAAGLVVEETRIIEDARALLDDAS